MNKSSPSGRGRKAFWEGGTALLNGMKRFPFYHVLKILNLHSTHRPPLGDSGQPADPGVEDWTQMIPGVRAEDLSRGLTAPAAWQCAFFGEEGEVGGATSQKEAERVTAPTGDTENSLGAGSRLRNSSASLFSSLLGTQGLSCQRSWQGGAPSRSHTPGCAGGHQVLTTCWLVSLGRSLLTSLCLSPNWGSKNAHLTEAGLNGVV